MKCRAAIFAILLFSVGLSWAVHAPENLAGNPFPGEPEWIGGRFVTGDSAMAALKQFYHFDQWPHEDRGLIQPPDFRSVSKRFLGDIQVRDPDLASARIIGKRGRLVWESYSSSERARGKLLNERLELTQAFPSYTVHYDSFRIGEIGDVMILCRYWLAEGYELEVNRGRYNFTVSASTDTSFLEDFARAVVATLDSMPVIASETQSPSFPKIGESTFPADIFDFDPHAEEWPYYRFRIDIPTGMSDLYHFWVGATINGSDRGFWGDCGILDQQRLQYTCSFHQYDLPKDFAVKEVVLQVSIINFHGEYTGRKFVWRKE